jgi:hypothetical protein
MILGIVKNRVYYFDTVKFGDILTEYVLRYSTFDKDEILIIKSRFNAKVYSSYQFIKLIADRKYRDSMRNYIINDATQYSATVEIQTNDDAELMCELLLN